MDLSNRYFVSLRSGTATNSVELNSVSATGALAFTQSYNTSGNPLALRSVKLLY